MKNFIKETSKMKKMKTSDLAAIIDENQKELVDFCINDGHKLKNQDIMKELHKRMFNEKFPKALRKIIKVGKKEEDHDGLDIGFVVIIAGFIEKNHNSDEMTEDLIRDYSDIIDELLKSRVKKIKKKVDIDESVIKELLLVTPDVGYISDEKFVGIYCRKMLRKLYVMSQNKNIGLENTEQVGKLFKALFGKKLVDLIAVNILLEKKEFMKNFNEEQIKIWNLMTAFALEFIENEEKNHIIELLEFYCVRRNADARKNRDAARRINKSMITEEQYPRLFKAITKFEKKGKESLTKYL